jgi:hypothetical protein
MNAICSHICFEMLTFDFACMITILWSILLKFTIDINQ